MTYADVKKFVTSWRGLCLLAVLVLAVLICVPAWQVERVRVGQDPPVDAYRLARLEDEYRRTLAQILAGCGLLVGLYLTWRRIVATEDNVRVAEETVRVAEEGHLTDRFTQAIAQLGEDNMAIRLGGIYALERIAKDSEKDHGPIMEVLTAYVREKAPRQEEDTQTAPAPLPADIQAILTVLGRRETTGKNRGTDRLDLNHTRLTRADLRGAELGGANLYEADLRGAELGDANLTWADLTRAILGGVPLPPEAPPAPAAPLLSPTNLDGIYPPPPVHLGAVNLTRADLRGANLGGATLTWADLRGVNLTKVDLIAAKLSGAILDGADLRAADLTLATLYEAELAGGTLPMGANLSGAKNLTANQVQLAQNWWHAQLPEDLQYLKDLPDPPARSAESEPKGA